MPGTQQVLNYCSQNEELKDPFIPGPQVSSAEHAPVCLGGGEGVQPSGGPKDRAPGVAHSSQAHGPLLAPRVPAWGEDAVPSTRRCFQPLTHQQAKANIVTGRSDPRLCYVM